MDSMVIFNADTAIFGAVTGTLLSTLEDSFFDYINPASTRNFGVPSSGIKVVDLLALIVAPLGSRLWGHPLDVRWKTQTDPPLTKKTFFA